jgi:NitT/TauT family transport system permease protein
MTKTDAIRPRRNLTRLPPPNVARLGLILALLAVWELYGRLWGDPLFIAPPSAAVLALIGLARDPAIRRAILTFTLEVSIAFGLSLMLGLAIGLWLGLSRRVRTIATPIVLFMYAMPQITILPVIMLLAGIGAGSKITFGVTHGVFPFTLGVCAAVQNLPNIFMATAVSMGASKWERFRFVLLPHMVTPLFASMRLCMSAVILGVLLAELFASTNGIGQFTRAFTQGFDPASLFALIAVIAVIAIFFNEALRLVERYFTRWRHPGKTI